MEKEKLSGQMKGRVKFIRNQEGEQTPARPTSNKTVQVSVSCVSQPCWQHSHYLAERRDCRRAAQGLVSPAGLLVCNKKSVSLRCFCTDPAWKPPESFAVLLSFPALWFPGAASQLTQLNSPGLPLTGAPGWSGHQGMQAWLSAWHGPVTAPRAVVTALPGHLCTLARTVAMAPSLWAVHIERGGAGPAGLLTGLRACRVVGPPRILEQGLTDPAGVRVPSTGRGRQESEDSERLCQRLHKEPSDFFSCQNFLGHHGCLWLSD